MLTTAIDSKSIHQAAKAVVIFAFILTAAMALVTNSAQARTDSIYTIKNVTVDVTAQSAVEAREQAFGRAQKQAFMTLLNRIVSGVDTSRFEEFDNQFIGSLVQDFEITSEKTSNVRYIGTYTFRFRKDAVQQLLNNNNLAYTDVSRKPVLILPFYHNGNQTVIWDQDNAWLNAWNKEDSYQGLVPVIVPIGDLMDTADIQNNQALSYNPDNLESMVSRYDAGEAMIVMALPQFTTGGEQPDTLDVMIYRTDRHTPELADKLTVSAGQVPDGQSIFDFGVRKTKEKMQKDWKQKTTASSSQSNNLKVRAQFKSMRQWVETHNALKRVQGVHSIKVVSLTPNHAILTMSFNGNESRLRLALAQSDITLTEPTVRFVNNGEYRHNSPLQYDLYLNKYSMPR